MITQLIMAMSMYLCGARSLSGRYFSAQDANAIVAQDVALKMCQAKSWRCYPVGCKIVTPLEKK
jgi:hypothetical protein